MGNRLRNAINGAVNRVTTGARNLVNRVTGRGGAPASRGGAKS